jgi:hypothetical protein
LQHFGRERTLGIVLWLCQSYAMTCVTDTLQLGPGPGAR